MSTTPNTAPKTPIQPMEVDSMDPDQMVELSRKLVRIQYPGIVKNVDKAVETLGGIHNIEKAVSNHRNVLELCYHPRNKYNKSCASDRDYNTGILIKVTAKIPKTSTSSGSSSTHQPSYDYSVVGMTAQNITFNRLCDFQYLPLVSKSEPETKQSDVDNIYTKIIPDTIPDLDFLKCEESKTMPYYFTPAAYGRFDHSNNKLYLGTGERYESEYRPEIASSISGSKSRSETKTVAKPLGKRHHHLAHTINYRGGKVPEKPTPYVMELLKEKSLTDEFQKVYKLFEERPIWTRAGIMYVSKLSFEHSKTILPAIAFYVRKGPWRSTWIKFGYDPSTEPEARFYQTLDYRIRTSEGSKNKIQLKRRTALKSFEHSGLLNLEKVSLEDDHPQKFKHEVTENCYILTPKSLPPARQLFYQYCDLKLPEVEKMLARLPQPLPDAKAHPKNGWLPAMFTEQCREVVNRYILETVKNEMALEQKALQQKRDQDSRESTIEPKPSTSSEYCSRMLSNIRKGIYTTIPIASSLPSTLSNEGRRNTDVVGDSSSLSGSDIIFEESAEEHIERTIPERLDENLLDDEDDDSSHASDDLDIDMEALEEVNRMIGMPNKLPEEMTE